MVWLVSAVNRTYTTIADPPTTDGGVDGEGVRRRRAWSWTSAASGVVVCTLGLWTLGAFTASDGTKRGRVGAAKPVSFKNVGFARLPADNDPADSLRVSVYNSYTRSKPIQIYPWEHLAEPVRPMTLEVAMSSDLGEGVQFRWEVEGAVIGYGSSLKTMFPSVGEYKCSVTAYSELPTSEVGDEAKDVVVTAEDADVEGTLRTVGVSTRWIKREFSVNVKYVRRELRSLTDRDREAFFNAIAVMQRVPTVVGRNFFGEKYRSKDYINRLHLYYGSGRDCDHWHEGAGFVTSHIALTLMFEQSLQAVNPSLSVPYWDFTIEGTSDAPDTFRDSGIFADDWFGTATPENSIRTPDRGRFAYVPAMTDASFFSSVVNAYGLLRSPWNSDKNPFMTRSDHLFGFINNMKPSGCADYQYTLKKNSWMALSKALNTQAHGHLHELMGGTWSKDYGEVASKLTLAVLPFLHTIQPYTKNLWRSGFYDCPESCEADVLWDDCQCTCVDEAMAGKTPTDILQDAGILESAFFYDPDGHLIDSFLDDQGHVYYTLPGYDLVETHKIFTELLRILCTPARIGTNYEGSSTNDPIFWVMHPTIDRAWHYSRLGNQDVNETWVADHTCYGHNPDDLQPFHHLFPSGEERKDTVTRAPFRRVASQDPVDSNRHAFHSEHPVGQATVRGGGIDLDGVMYRDRLNVFDSPASIGEGRRKLEKLKQRLAEVEPVKSYYTNRDIYEFLRPDRDEMPYLYDNFEWPHCDAQGIDMDVYRS